MNLATAAYADANNKSEGSHSTSEVSGIESSSILLLDRADINSDLILNEFSKNDIAISLEKIDSALNLLEQLESNNWECILLAIDEVSVSLPQLINAMPECNAHTPLIILINEYDRSKALKYLDEGADDVVSIDELEYLTYTVTKKIEASKLNSVLLHQTQTVEDAKNRFKILSTQLPLPLSIIQEGVFIFANPAFQTFFGFNDSGNINEVSFLDLIDPSDLGKVKNIFRQFSNNPEMQDTSLKSISLKTTHDKKIRGSLLLARTHYNNESMIQVIVQPELAAAPNPKLSVNKKLVAEEPKAKKTAFMATDIILQTLNKVLQSSITGKKHALCFLEIDSFEQIKKRIGIRRSDLLLSEISDYILAQKQPNTLISKLTPDVFLIMISDTSSEACVEKMQVMQDSLHQHQFTINEQTVEIFGNVGFVNLTKDIGNADQAMSYADVACAVSRNRGDHRVHVHNPKQDRSTIESVDLGWTSRIQDALSNDNFKLVFQPIVQINNSATPIYEVLLRMKSTEGEDILASDFLPAAKQSRLDLDIDKWVINRTMKLFQRSSQKDLHFFVHLSESSIKDIDFINWLKTKNPESLKRLVFQISKQVALQLPSEVLHFTQECKMLGIKLCILHVGSNQTSEEQLQSFEADFYKVDGSFINHLSTNRKHQTVVHDIAKTAQQLKVKTIACFVQDAASLAILWQEGVDYIQGNYLQAPEARLDYKFES